MVLCYSNKSWLSPWICLYYSVESYHQFLRRLSLNWSPSFCHFSSKYISTEQPYCSFIYMSNSVIPQNFRSSPYFLCVLDCVQLFVTAQTVACLDPFSQKEYWSGLSFPSPGDLPDQGLNLYLLHWQTDS